MSNIYYLVYSQSFGDTLAATPTLRYLSKSHRKKMPQEQQPEVSEASDTDDVIELTAKDIRPWDGVRPLKEGGDIRLKSGASSPAEKDDKKPVETLAPIKKPATQKQLESMKRAQAARQE